MNKSVFFVFLGFSFFTGAFAQRAPDYKHSDAVARAVPAPAGKSIVSLSDYFNTRLTSEKELVRAFYYWIAHEILYDMEDPFTFRSSGHSDDLVTQTLQRRKAVCQGFSEVFQALCENAGIESYVVYGYTRQNGQVVDINHAWVAACIENRWFLFDPTWGSGYFMNGRYTRKFTNEYFMVRPSDFIQSHMPFDPLWQCLNDPVSFRNFDRGSDQKATGGYFNYPDSIGRYRQLTKPEKDVSALRRMEKNGPGNSTVMEYRRYLQRGLEIDRTNRQYEIQNQQVRAFNTAVNEYNLTVALFNEYIAYWNHQFKPARPDAEIGKMLDSCDYHLNRITTILEGTRPLDKAMERNLEVLSKPVQDIRRQIDEQREFLRNYFDTPVALRWSLFSKYSWLGGR